MSRADAMRRPDYMDGVAAEMWDDMAATLVRMGTLTEDTRDRFAKACCAFAEFRRIRAEMGDDLDAKGSRRLVAAMRLYMRHSRGFGMTPMDRVRLYEAGKLDRRWLVSPRDGSPTGAA